MNVKNMSFPFCARRMDSSDTNLIGVESIEYLKSMKELGKQDQYLFFYNFKNKKYLRENCGRRHPYYVKSEERSRQTTFIIDFDNLVPSIKSTVRDSFESFKTFLDGKPVLVDSPSGGLHVIYAVHGAVPEQEYRRIQEYIVKGFFKNVEQFMDKPASFSLKRGFFHSQHLADWIKKKRVNPSPGGQKKHGFFWNKDFVISYEELIRVMDFCCPLEDRRIFELAEDAGTMLNFIRFIAEKKLDEKKEGGTERFLRILAEIRKKEQGRTQKSSEEIINRAQTEQYKTALECIQSTTSEAILGAETVSEVYRELVSRPSKEGIAGSTETDGRDTQEARIPSLQGNRAEVRGHGNRGDLRHDRAETGRHRNAFGDECLLAALSGIRDSLKARGFTNKKLGELLLKNSLRGDFDGNYVTEKSDLGLFTTVLRETMDGDTRIRRHLDSSPERIFFWLRDTRRHLRTKGKLERSLSEFTSNAARCLRLYLKTQNIEINYAGSEYPRSVSVTETRALILISMARDRLHTLIAGLSRANQQTVLKIFREDHEFLTSGVRALLSYIKERYPLIKSSKPIAVGMEDFQHFFQTHNRKATALRHVFMRVLSFEKTEYVPCVKRRSFLLDIKVLEEIFESPVETPSNASELAVKLGRGRTWNSICRYIKPMYKTFGLSRTRDIWYSALDISSANDQEKRKVDIERFLERIEEQESKDADTIKRQKDHNCDFGRSNEGIAHPAGGLQPSRGSDRKRTGQDAVQESF